MRRTGRIWIVMVCALVLTACGADDSTETGPAPATPPAATAPPAPETEMEIGPIVWAQELDAETGEPTDIVTRFTTESPAIIAVVEVNDLVEGTEFTATWSIDGQAIDDFDMDITASEDLEHSWVVFRFTRDEGQRYPVGQLNVVVTSSEGDMREGSVEIGFP